MERGADECRRCEVIMKNVVIVDGFGIIFRYYYALRLTNSRGENTACIFGFFNTVLNLLNKLKPDYFVVALEGKTPCFRKEIYPEYKANRPPAPEDLTAQIPKIITLLEQLNIPHIYKDGYEADDIIGTVSHHFAQNEDTRVYILSSDKDMRQLITNNVVVVRPEKNNDFIEMDVQYIIDNMKMKPPQVIDYLALLGDASDNIPGVKGIGEKSATQLLEKYESIEDIYEHVGNISGKTCEKLIAGKDDAFLSKKLATIVQDVPLRFEDESLKVKPFNLDAALEMLRSEDLNSIITKVITYNKSFVGTTESFAASDTSSETAKPPVKEKLSAPNYDLIISKDELDKKITQIKEKGLMVFDLETTGLDCFTDKIICMSICVGEGMSNDTFVIPFKLGPIAAAEVPNEINDDWTAAVIESLKPIFADDQIIKIGHNLKFDLKFLKTYGVDFANNCFDTMLAQYCLDGAEDSYGLKELTAKYFDFQPQTYEMTVGNPKENTLLDVPLANLVNYSGQDAFITYRLYRILREQITGSESIRKLFYEIEMPLMLVIAKMEYTGVCINKSALEDFSAQLDKQSGEILHQMQTVFGNEFNPNSPKQVGELLYNIIGLQPPRSAKKTKNGYSTDAQVLSDLAAANPNEPLPVMLLDYRLLSKVKSTYTDSLPKMVNPVTNRIHTTFLQTGTQTGRLSSRDPNLQNIPVRTDIGRNIRRAFIPSDGDHILISADYSQIEIYLLAEFSRDPMLVKAFQTGEDVHRMTASLIFDKQPNEVTKQERSIAKTVNFGVLYGQSAFSLSTELKISVGEAKRFIDKYFQKYAGVAQYMNTLKSKARNNGYSETFCGRRRTIVGIHDLNKTVAAAADRMAVNSVIQGSAADLIKTAMIAVQRALEQYHLRSRMILQVHDELIFDALRSEQNDVVQIIRDKMEHPGFDFLLPLKTEIECGDNWGEFH